MRMKTCEWVARRYWQKDTNKGWEWAHEDNWFMAESQARKWLAYKTPSKTHPIYRLYKVMESVVDGQPIEDEWLMVEEMILGEELPR